MLKLYHHDTGQGLKGMTDEKLATGFQVSDKNPLLGVASRAALLRSLGASLLENPTIFGEQGRPGNLVGKMALPTTQAIMMCALTGPQIT
jgi:hypothetical protein